MKPRFLIFISVVLLLMVALLLWRRPVQPPVNQSTNAPIATANAASNNTRPVAPTPAPLPTVNQPLVVTHKVETPEQARQEIESANVPVHFYGLVIDQDSNALSGVNIKVVVRHWTMPDPNIELAGSDEIPLEATTGVDGRFELTGATGDGFNITSFQKDGYERESGQRGFGAVSGSYENPIVFKMWRTDIHEKLITGKYAFHIVPDGKPYFINLTEGTISESGTGDLKVWIKRPEQITYGTRYDWSSEVDIINGGLQAASDYAMWMAPANGYVPSFQFEQTIGSGWGDSTGERRFYISLNNGQEYGHITIELYAYYNNQIPGLIRLSYAINPSGSRILR